METLAKGLAKAQARWEKPEGAEGQASASQSDAPDDELLDLSSLARVEPDPAIWSDSRIVVDEESPASSAYKMLRTRVLQRMRRNGWSTLAVTGTCPGEGKSLTAINLSIGLARDMGTSVVLADLDLRKPSLFYHLGISAPRGLNDYFRGEARLEQVAVCPGVDRLGVLLNEHSFPNSSDILSSPRAEHLVSRAKQGEGRIAVFDLPPVIVSDDMLAFCPLVDAVLLVVAQGTTRQTDMDAARDLLQNVNVVGVVLNRSSEQIAPYYYYGAARR